MPKLLAKVEGKGNAARTVIVNMPEIAKSLNRPPMYIVEYMDSILGNQVSSVTKPGRYIVSGAHNANKLQDLLDGFTQKCVLCQSCKKPETSLSVDKRKEVISMHCTACNSTGTLQLDDRLAAYILKNPPPKSATITAPSAAASAPSASDLGSKTTNDDEDEIDDLDDDDLDLDYGDDDDDDYEYQTQSQKSSKQSGSSQQVYNDSMSHHDGEENDDDMGDEDEDDDVDHDVDADESLDADANMGENDADQSDTEKDGDKVRCRYWPSCNAQDNCQFYHPTKPCRDFLRCTYGDRCLYIHPPCKFSPNCTKPNCPFSHPAIVSTGVKRKASAMQFRNMQPSAPKCKFGFKCTNLMCKFSHQASEDCRYGANCLLESCPYNHPTDSMPRKKPASVFKWSAQS